VRTNGVTKLTTNRGTIDAKLVVNCAGWGAGEVASLFGDGSIQLEFIKGEEAILDKKVGGLLSVIIFPMPTSISKGILVTPTTGGNLLIGPTAEPQTEYDTATTCEGLHSVISAAQQLVPGIHAADIIATYAGVRVQSETGDFEIRRSDVVPNLIHVAGIKSPGLTAAPAIGLEVVRLIAETLTLKPKVDFNPRRKINCIRDLPLEQRHVEILKNPLYGRIVCRCEQVSEGEIRDALRGTLPARTLAGVKYRTRAGMGRCQGSFCTPHLLEVMANELKCTVEKVTQKGCNSSLILGARKEEHLCTCMK